MLSSQHFYYQSIKRSIVAFGTLFKDIQLVTYTNDAAHAELKRIVVPLIYGDKEDYFIRLKQAGTLPIPTDLPLPRMMFRMSNFYYDTSRKQQSQLQQYAASGVAGGINAQFVPVPYNMDFELGIYVRNTEDGCQIVEQICPYFTPEYTLKMVFVDQLGLIKNIPVVLKDVNRSLENEGATDWTMRREVWTLNFTMQTYLFGPTQSSGLIKQANTNFWFYGGTQESGQNLNLTLLPGFHSFKVGEVVYQGSSLQQATAVGYAQAFDASQNLLSVYQQSGTFIANANVKGAVTSASWNVAAMPVVTPIATITASVVPPTANLGDDFGFSVVVTEPL